MRYKVDDLAIMGEWISLFWRLVGSVTDLYLYMKIQVCNVLIAHTHTKL